MKLFPTLLLLALAACGGDAKDDATGETETAELGKCCTKALAVMAELPGCCQSGLAVAGEPSGCCANGMLDEEAPEGLADCCAEGRAKLEALSDCCMDVLRTGEEGDCCEGMVAAVAKEFGE